jgi:hypothetical protein
LAGFTVIEELVSPPGLHKYVPPIAEGVAVKVAADPLQIVTLFTETVGALFTVTIPKEVGLTHPFKVYTTE